MLIHIVAEAVVGFYFASSVVFSEYVRSSDDGTGTTGAGGPRSADNETFPSVHQTDRTHSESPPEYGVRA